MGVGKRPCRGNVVRDKPRVLQAGLPVRNAWPENSVDDCLRVVSFVEKVRASVELGRKAVPLPRG